jgi:hypothetical protein
MKLRFLPALIVSLGFLSAATFAHAATYDVDFTGTDSQGAVTANLVLDVTGGQVVSGTGTITTAVLGVGGSQGWGTAPLTFLSSPSLNYTFGFNGGTNIQGVDNVFPIDTNGLMFDVGPTGLNGWRQAGAGFALWSVGGNNYQAGLWDNVNGGHEYEVINGTASVSAVPLPAALPLFGAAVMGLGAFGFMRRNKKSQANLSNLA